MNIVHESLLVFRRALRLSLRNPVWVIIGLIQPLVYLSLFGPLLKQVAKTPGFPAGDAWQVFVPGLLVQLGLFGAAFVGFGLVQEMRDGVVERMRVTPAARASLLIGRVLRDVVVLLVQGVVLVLASVAFGLRAPVGDIILGLLVVALLGAAFASLSYALALRTGSEDSLASILNTVTVPLLLLSGILLPMSLAPGWLRTLSDVNPLKHVVEAVRQLFHGGDGSTIAIGLALTAALVVVGVAIGTRTFQRESA
jgi:ABC-2 type transport system permease protein